MRTIFDELDELQHDRHFEHVAAKHPTNAPAGSAEKIEIMRGRVERGECLYHRDDSTEQIEPELCRKYRPGIRECEVGELTSAVDG